MKVCKRRGKRQWGFTLIELAVALAVIAILTAFAVPAVRTWIPNYRLKKAARDMFSNFQNAKLNAIKKSTNYAIVFNKPIGAVVYDYIVFKDHPNDIDPMLIDNALEYNPTAQTDLRDNDGDGMTDESTTNGIDDDGDGLTDEADEIADEEETIIARVRWADSCRGVSFGAGGITFANNDNGLPAVAFRRNGLPVNNGGGMGIGTVFLTNTNGRTTSIVISAAGNIRIP